MRKNYQEVLNRINCLSNDLDAIYHQAARRLGVAESVMIVSYMIYEKGDGCLLYDICHESGVSKQTINSALRKMERDDILYLQQDKGRKKRIFLTEKGHTFVREIAGRLLDAECNAFSGWTDEELEIHLRLMERYNKAFRAEIEKICERS